MTQNTAVPQGMIDVHIHILPGVDDGSFSPEESLRMARMAVEGGVCAMALTPHCNLPGEAHPLWAADFRERIRVFRQFLRQNRVPLRVYEGMEIFGTPEVPELFRAGKLLTLGGSRYPLIEFPFTDYGEEATKILHRVLRLGLRPLVAHPERYRYVQNEPRLLNLWTDMGCLLQVNRGSLLGRFGPGSADTAYAMLDRSFVACVGSDAHRSTVRTPRMQDVWKILYREYGERTAVRLLRDNPARMITNQEIKTEEPDWF